MTNTISEITLTKKKRWTEGTGETNEYLKHPKRGCLVLREELCTRKYSLIVNTFSLKYVHVGNTYRRCKM